MTIGRIASLALAAGLLATGLLLSLDSRGQSADVARCAPPNGRAAVSAAAPDGAGRSACLSQPRPVRVTRVEALTTGPQVRLSAVTRATDRARVSFPFGGRLLARPVRVGDRVAAGDVLARLDPEPLRNALAAADAQLAGLNARIAQAARDVRRYERLAASGAMATAEQENAAAGLTTLRAQRRALRAGRDEARRQLEESTAAAPYAGVVAAVLAEPGEVVAPGSPVLLLAGDGGVEVEIEVPETLLGQLHVGAPIPVELPLVGLTGLVGTVRAVGDATVAGRLFPVLVALPEDPAVRPGVTAEVLFSAGAAPGLAVPVSAVANPSGAAASVLRVRDGRVERVPITTGVLVGDRVAVDGPISDGDLVVVAGHAWLVSDDAVEVMP